MATWDDESKRMSIARCPAPRRLRLQIAAWRAFTAVTATVAITLSSGCSRSTFIQNPYGAIPRSTPEQIRQVHQPEALHADLYAIVALHERTSPNPYLRVQRESIRGLAEKLKASIDRSMTWRQFRPLVMELQAGYRSDHYVQGVPQRGSSEFRAGYRA